jgi:hypothetical protein
VSKSAKRRRAVCTVNVLRCKFCGTFAVSVNDHRITNHKCAGAWDIVRSEPVEVAEIQRGLAQRVSV